MSATYPSAVPVSRAAQTKSANPSSFLNLAIPALCLWAAIVATALVNPGVSIVADEAAVQFNIAP